MTLQTNFYFLSPVEVVKVTPKNLEEVAAWCGGKVAETESRRVEGRMDKYVWVPTPKGSAISWAFPGMFITKRVVITEKDEIKVTYSVFRKDYFNKNYFEGPDVAVEHTWERQMKEAGVKFDRTKTKAELAQGPLKDLDVKDNLIQGVPRTAINEQASMIDQRVVAREHLIEMASRDPHRA